MCSCVGGQGSSRVWGSEADRGWEEGIRERWNLDSLSHLHLLPQPRTYVASATSFYVATSTWTLPFAAGTCL